MQVTLEQCASEIAKLEQAVEQLKAQFNQVVGMLSVWKKMKEDVEKDAANEEGRKD